MKTHQSKNAFTLCTSCQFECGHKYCAFGETTCNFCPNNSDDAPYCKCLEETELNECPYYRKDEINNNLEEKQMEITTKINKILKECGVSPRLYGYEYLSTAIEMVYNDKDIIHRRLTKEIYPTIAKAHHTRPSAVERSIRHAITTAYDRGNLDLLNEIFGYTISANRGRATNAEFIATIADYVKEQSNEQR